MLKINSLHATIADARDTLRAFAASRESLTQLGRARTLGIYLTPRREGAKTGIAFGVSVG